MGKWPRLLKQRGKGKEKRSSLKNLDKPSSMLDYRRLNKNHKLMTEMDLWYCLLSFKVICQFSFMSVNESLCRLASLAQCDVSTARAEVRVFSWAHKWCHRRPPKFWWTEREGGQIIIDTGECRVNVKIPFPMVFCGSATIKVHSTYTDINSNK